MDHTRDVVDIGLLESEISFLRERIETAETMFSGKDLEEKTEELRWRVDELEERLETLKACSREERLVLDVAVAGAHVGPAPPDAPRDGTRWTDTSFDEDRRCTWMDGKWLGDPKRNSWNSYWHKSMAAPPVSENPLRYIQ